LPCRRSWVRVPSSASKTPVNRGFSLLKSNHTPVCSPRFLPKLNNLLRSSVAGFAILYPHRLGHRPLTAAARVRIPYGPFDTVWWSRFGSTMRCQTCRGCRVRTCGDHSVITRSCRVALCEGRPVPRRLSLPRMRRLRPALVRQLRWWPSFQFVSPNAQELHLRLPPCRKSSSKAKSFSEEG
jgi:hypothetical protein